MRGLLLGLLPFLVILAVACAGAGAEPTPTKGPPGRPGPEGVSGPVPRPAAVPTPTPAPRLSAAMTASDGRTTIVLKDEQQRLIIRSASVALAVKGVPEAVDAVVQLVDRLEGIVVSSSIRGEGQETSATVSFRVPVERFDEALTGLRALAVRVLSEDTSSQDVTEEYVDLDAQRRNLEATESQYLAILNRAETVEDVLKVQREISNVRDQIERSKARLQYLERTSAMSMVSVYLSPTTSQKPLVEPGWSATETSRSAARGFVSAGQTVADTLIRIVVFSPFWLPVAAVLVAPVYLWRRSRRKGA
ncbi:MAG: DUF4349 domain-containing protein [Chloroflexi bacterium]|nr:DUF4349 domain-containing protein [Chloroflexota bacterium]